MEKPALAALQPLQSPSKASALSSFAAKSPSQAPSTLASFAASKPLAGIQPLKPTHADFEPLKSDLRPISPGKGPGATSALARFASSSHQESTSSRSLVPNELAPVSPKKPSALASFAATTKAEMAGAHVGPSSKPSNARPSGLSVDIEGRPPSNAPQRLNKYSALGSSPPAVDDDEAVADDKGVSTPRPPPTNGRNDDDDRGAKDEPTTPRGRPAKDGGDSERERRRSEAKKTRHNDDSDEEKEDAIRTSDRHNFRSHGPDDDEKATSDDEDDDKETKDKASSSSDDDEKQVASSQPTPPTALRFPKRASDPFMHAVLTHDVAALQALFQADHGAVHYRPGNRRTALLAHLATIRDAWDRTLLQVALGLGHVDMCRLLLALPLAASGCDNRSSSSKSPKRRSGVSPQKPSPSKSPTKSVATDNSHRTSPLQAEDDTRLSKHELAILIYGFVMPQDGQRRSLLHFICHSRNPTVFDLVQEQPCITRLLRRHVIELDARDQVGLRPVAYAAHRGYSHTIQWCFQLGCGASYIPRDVDRIMALAATTATRRALVRGLEQLDMQRTHDRRYDVAMDDDDADVSPPTLSVQPWLQYFAQTDINAVSGSLLQSSLHKIAQFGCVDELEAALARGVDVNAVDANGWTALHYCACSRGPAAAVDIAARLVACDDIQLDIPSMQGKTPLHVAAAGGRLEVLELLLDTNLADVNAVDTNGWTPLHGAAHADDVLAAKRLVQHAACNVYAVTPAKQTALHVAASAGADGVIALLCAWDIETQRLVVAQDSHGRVPAALAKSAHARDRFQSLWQLAWQGQPDKMQAMLVGHNIDDDDEHGVRGQLKHHTPQTHKNSLHLVVRAVVTSFTGYNCRIDPGLHGTQPCASFSSILPTTYRYPFVCVSLACDNTRVLDLYHHGGRNMRDHAGVTPLMLAAASGNVALAQALRPRHVALDTVDVNGNTALHYAYAFGKSAVARWLEGLDRDLASQENADQRTPLDVSGWKHKIYPKKRAIAWSSCCRDGGESDETDDDGGCE
ncbi:Aste57867_12234 [Aphanomyces stellatus]|uniref:Aste57867_12234 protein n=1 Tax=Aphanomyces stellatus TaxID=120398 RepID=A0A485KV07_9STRA|nr:hypothetical protein As57867_012189 [Aphanomyces stellatus]VFT89088.1 Aste57867_12234 [Aphanomyces stellatus]